MQHNAKQQLMCRPRMVACLLFDKGPSFILNEGEQLAFGVAAWFTDRCWPRST
jgi:hypothetical protein